VDLIDASSNDDDVREALPEHDLGREVALSERVGPCFELHPRRHVHHPRLVAQLVRADESAKEHAAGLSDWR